MNSAFPIKLQAKQVVLAAFERFEAGTLAAQANPSSEGCYYRDRKGYPCAIGAAMSDEQVTSLKNKRWQEDGVRRTGNHATLHDLMTRGLVDIIGADGKSDERAGEDMIGLQEAHDFYSLYSSVDARQTFGRVLQRLHNKYAEGES